MCGETVEQACERPGEPAAGLLQAPSGSRVERPEPQGRCAGESQAGRGDEGAGAGQVAGTSPSGSPGQPSQRSVTRSPPLPDRSGQTALQGPGGRGLAPAGIGPGNGPVLAPPHGQGLAGRAARQQAGDQDHHPPGQAGGHIVEQVVEAGPAPAEAEVARDPVSVSASRVIRYALPTTPIPDARGCPRNPGDAGSRRESPPIPPGAAPGG